jgi:hypothetical protein
MKIFPILLLFLFSLSINAQCNLTAKTLVLREIKLNQNISNLNSRFVIINKITNGNIKTGIIIFDDAEYSLTFTDDVLTKINVKYTDSGFTNLFDFQKSLSDSLRLPTIWDIPSIPSKNDLQKLGKSPKNEIYGIPSSVPSYVPTTKTEEYEGSARFIDNNLLTYRTVKVNLELAQKEYDRAARLFESGDVDKYFVDSRKAKLEFYQIAMIETSPQLIKLDELYNQKENLLKLFKEKHPDVVAKQNEIDRLRDSINFSNKRNIAEESVLTCKDFVLTASFNGKTPTLEVSAIKMKPLKQKKVFKP